MLSALPTRSATPSVHLTYPHSSLFTFPPSSVPEVLLPPTSGHTLARPFAIDPKTYNDLLSVNYPITIALIYATTVTLLNRINKRRGNKPWAISKSYAFWAFVLLHNVFLALYSAWTFVGMFNALRHAWPGLKGKDGLAGAVDALCKIHGPRGLGNAVTYNSTNSLWGVTNKAVKLATGGSPDSTDVGRIWNEGLAYYGWLFYLSKFYEVVDTAIVLAKGKKSSLLQTYHHAGAMLCMWAGIRYMAPPIWMFALVNSLVHAMMYTYYAVSALGIRVPQAVKRALTTLQISQFVVGATFALAHLFVAYDIPVSVPYRFVHNLSSAIPQAASSVSSAVASATVSAGMGGWLKKMAFRAAGEEGLAENVRNDRGEAFGIDAVHSQEAEKAREEIRYRNEYQTIPCVDTSGQAFAILLNVFYLAPLTYLFVDFFIRSYLRRTSSSTKKPTHEHAVGKSRKDASKGIERELREAMNEDQSRGNISAPKDFSTEVNELKSNVKQGVDNLSHKAQQGLGKVQDAVNKGKENAKGAINKAQESAKDAMNYSQKKVDESKVQARDAIDKTQPKVEQAKENLKDSAAKAQKKAEQGKEEAKNGLGKAQKAMEHGKANAKDATEKVQDKYEQGKAAGKDGVNKAQDKAEQSKASAEEAGEQAKEKTEQGKAAAKEGVDKTQKKAEQGKASAKDSAEKAESKAKDGADKTQKKAEESEGAAKDGVENTEKKAQQGKADVKKAADNAEHDSSDGELVSTEEHDDATAYEVNPDEVKDDAEKKAEQKMQPHPRGNEAEGDEDADEDAAALEASIDEVTNRDEKEAENKMQPNGP